MNFSRTDSNYFLPNMIPYDTPVSFRTLFGSTWLYLPMGTM